MGTFIVHELLKQHANAWLLPHDLVKYDRRNSPWPNDWFQPQPLVLEIEKLVQKTLPAPPLMVLRRWCEQNLRGDVVVLHEAYQHPPQLQLWIEHPEDFALCEDYWQTALTPPPMCVKLASPKEESSNQ